MTKFEIITPSIAKVVDPQLKQLLRDKPLQDKNMFLSYRLNKIQNHLQKALLNHNYKYAIKLEKEQKELMQSLYRPISWIDNDNNEVYIRPGYIPYLDDSIKLTIQPESPYVEYKYNLPKPRPYPYYRPLKYTPYPYQLQALNLLLQHRHATVEMATGTGKTLLMIMLAQKLGLKTIIVTPFVSIFQQILDEFTYYFGSSAVGVYGGGKKKNPNARFVIAVSDSIANITSNHKDFEYFKSFEVAIFDEAHTLSAETLEAMAFGPLSEVPYRYFLTGTHTRPDGLTELLKAITGPVIMRYDTAQAIKDGYICPFKIKIINVPKPNYNDINIDEKDVLSVKRWYFLYNENIAKVIADNLMHNIIIPGDKNRRSSLILVNEIKQIYLLYKILYEQLQNYNMAHLRLNDLIAVAVSTTTEEAVIRAIIPESIKKKYRYVKNLAFYIKSNNLFLGDIEKSFIELIINSDISQSINDFNLGKKRILIGTSAISTGVNLFPTHFTFNWQGGSSEIACKQGAIGRSIRKLELSPYANLHEPKPFAIIIDFNVQNQPILYTMLKKRLKYYAE